MTTRDGEEHGDRLRAHLEREDLAHGQIAGAGTRGGEEEDHAPRDGLGRGGAQVLVEQGSGNREHRA